MASRRKTRAEVTGGRPPSLGLSLGRVLHVATVVARHAAAQLLPRWLVRLPWLARRLPAGDLPEPERLRTFFQDLGGTFLKLGQMLALQPDILPLAYCNALRNLLDRVPPFAMEEVEAILVEELGRGSSEIFDSFEPQPLAAASIGQVHGAYLMGEKVAVKVQRPTARRDFAGDIRLLKIAVVWIPRLRLKRLYFLLELFREFIGWTEDELDYRTEARYVESLRRNSRASRTQHMPKVLDRYTTRRTLVMEFLDGITILDYLRARDRGDEVTLRRLATFGFEPVRFAGNLIDNFVYQVFVHGFFHADLHPANLMILPGNVVGYLDFGITGGLSPFSRRHLVAMTRAWVRGDLDGLNDAFLKISKVSPSGPAAAAYREGLARLGEDWYEEWGGRVRLRKSFTVVMLEMLRLSRQTNVWAQRDVIKYLRSTLALDGLLSQVVPGMDLGPRLEHACRRHIVRSVLADAITSHQLLEWSASSARLMLESGPATAAALDRLAGGEVTLRTTGDSTRRRDERGESSWVLAALILSLSLLIITRDSAIDLGWNLFTAQALLLAVALGAFLFNLRRVFGS